MPRASFFSIWFWSLENMKATTKDSTMIRPAEETPKGSLWISNIDLVASRGFRPKLFIYKPNGSFNFFEACSRLKEALSKALVPFYPVAGRFGRDETGRIQVHCNAEGALFVEAEIDATLDDFGHFTPCPEMHHLLPTVDDSGDISSFPLLNIQLTYFRCGGVSLGLLFHHTLVDGPAALHFLNSWANITRGLDIETAPFLDRTLLRPRDPPAPTFDHIEYQPVPILNKPVGKPDHEPTSSKLFKITLDQLNYLKAKSNKDDGTSKYSTVQVLAAHVWRCTCKARSLPKDQPTKLSFALDGRSRLHPSLPPSYFGNVNFTIAMVCSTGVIISEPLERTIKRVHEQITKIGDEYLRSAIDYWQLQQNIERGNVIGGAVNLHVVSWTRLPTHDTDFGFGRPVFMGQTSIANGRAYIMQNSAGDGSLSLGICLESRNMPLFEELLYKF